MPGDSGTGCLRVAAWRSTSSVSRVPECEEERKAPDVRFQMLPAIFPAYGELFIVETMERDIPEPGCIIRVQNVAKYGLVSQIFLLDLASANLTLPSGSSETPSRRCRTCCGSLMSSRNEVATSRTLFGASGLVPVVRLHR